VVPHPASPTSATGTLYGVVVGMGTLVVVVEVVVVEVVVVEVEDVDVVLVVGLDVVAVASTNAEGTGATSEVSGAATFSGGAVDATDASESDEQAAITIITSAIVDMRNA
jgi:hypothetical protein